MHENFIRQSSGLRTGSTSFFYTYDETVRALILNAKVNGNVAALAYMIKAFVKGAKQRLDAKSIQAIMPMPSSLWGRYNGRIDIAYHLGFHLAKAMQVSFTSPPWRTGWHIKKRAMLNAADRGKDVTVSVRTASEVGDPSGLILVVDDLWTTGNSYAKLQEALRGKKSSLLAFAGKGSA